MGDQRAGVPVQCAVEWIQFLKNGGPWKMGEPGKQETPARACGSTTDNRKTEAEGNRPSHGCLNN